MRRIGKKKKGKKGAEPTPEPEIPVPPPEPEPVVEDDWMAGSKKDKKKKKGKVCFHFHCSTEFLKARTLVKSRDLRTPIPAGRTKIRGDGRRASFDSAISRRRQASSTIGERRVSPNAPISP